MLRKVVAVTVLVAGLGTLPGTAARAEEPQTAVCKTDCATPHEDARSARDAMNEDVARIAIRATVPAAHAAPLSRGDLLELYLLLAVQGHAQNGRP
jgi:uncharacterized membrane protein YebE (DUF533 family)